jgi:hypothetical protein
LVKKIWVHTNATKHIAEYSASNPFSHLKNINEQVILRSFNNAVKKAIPTLTQNDRNFVNVGGLELGIDTTTGVPFYIMALCLNNIINENYTINRNFENMGHRFVLEPV